LAWVALIGGVKEPPKSCIWEYWTIKDGKERKLKLPSEERDIHQNKQNNCSIIMILQSVSRSIGSCTAACYWISSIMGPQNNIIYFLS